jgi:3-methyladenine DNA glycosylase AlkD
MATSLGALSAPALLVQARAQLRELARPADAAPMAAYLKADPASFLGVKAPARRQVLRALPRELARDLPVLRAVVEGLWDGPVDAPPMREERQLAVDLAGRFRAFVTLDQLDLFERMVREGAWWDLVDAVASSLVGGVWLRERATVGPLMDQWIGDRDLWIRRTAIIGQLKHKENTDLERLFAYCRATMHEREFFIAKAIGWALREQAKVRPAEVQAFLVAEWPRLQPLSRREASRRMVQAGWVPPA